MDSSDAEMGATDHPSGKKMTPQVRLELEQLLGTMCDGSLNDDEHVRLEAMLAGDAECRLHYLEYIDIHARLLVHPGVAAPLPAPNVVAMEGISASPGRPPRRYGGILRYVAVAAAALVVSLLVQFLWRQGPWQNDSSNGVPAEPFATLTQTADCAWEGAQSGLRPGARIGADELRLTKGVARLRFDSGPEVVLEGPAALRLESPTTATLRHGKFVFRTDNTSPPFELKTPSAKLEDLGTEYAILITQEGEEVHVFEGEVRRTPKAAPTETEVLAAGEARRYAGPKRIAASMPLDTAKFVRRVPGPAPGDAAGLLAYEGFDYADGDALGKGRGTGGSGWAGPWQAPRTFNKFARPAPLNPRVGLSRPGGVGAGGCFEAIGYVKCSRRLATPVRLDEDGTYYLSFLFGRPPGPPGPPDTMSSIFVSLRPDDDAPFGHEDFSRRLSVGVGGSNHVFCRLHGVGPRVPVPLNSGQTYLLVMKILARHGQPAQMFVRVYGADEPVDREEPMTWTASGPPVRSDLAMNSLEIQINGHRRQQIDEIRLGKSWPSVTAAWASDRPNP